MAVWPSKKASYKGASVPFVTLPDGMQLQEMIPTCIYFGRILGQYPRDPEMAHMMESLLLEVQPVYSGGTRASLHKDDAEYKEFVEGKASAYIAKVEPLLAKTKWILGDKLTVIDFWVGALYCDKIANSCNKNANQTACWAGVL